MASIYSILWNDVINNEILKMKKANENISISMKTGVMKSQRMAIINDI